jgi:predicted thioesterase
MLEPGLEATATETVTDDMTATRLGSGDVPVLGTPAVLALAERAALEAVAGHLEDGVTTVGTRVELDHLAPTPVGGRVAATARLESVEGRTLRFTVAVVDAYGTVARATHERATVDRRDFLDTAANRPG